jgi:hypothetical protein
MRNRPNLLSALLLAVLSAGCDTGTRLAYDHLGTLARWETGKYVEMTDAQKAAFDREFKPVWDWNRQTQLPLYAAEARKIAGLLDAGNPDAATVERISDDLDVFGTAVGDEIRPGAARLLGLLDDAQVEKFAADRRKEFDKAFRKQSGRRLEARRDKEQREREDAVKTWIGPLNAAQKAVLASNIDEDIARGAFDPERQRAERNRQLDRFLGLLKQRRQPDFELRIKDMQQPTDPAIKHEEDELETRSRARLAALAATLDAAQRQYLKRRLLSFADDFDALVAEAHLAKAEPAPHS